MCLVPMHASLARLLLASNLNLVICTKSLSAQSSAYLSHIALQPHLTFKSFFPLSHFSLSSPSHSLVSAYPSATHLLLLQCNFPADYNHNEHHDEAAPKKELDMCKVGFCMLLKVCKEALQTEYVQYHLPLPPSLPLPHI